MAAHQCNDFWETYITFMLQPAHPPHPHPHPAPHHSACGVVPHTHTPTHTPPGGDAAAVGGGSRSC